MPEHEHHGSPPPSSPELDLAGWDADERLIDNSFGDSGDSAEAVPESMGAAAGLEHAAHDHGGHEPGGHGPGHGGHGGHDHPVELVQELEHAGHKVTVRTRFEIEIDGHKVQTHIMIRNGRIVTHALPYFSFETPLELGKSLAEHYGRDF